MALDIITICDSIASLAIPGARIYDINEIPETVGTRKPAIFPRPDGFVSNIQVTRDSFGGGNTAKTSVSYTLNYRLCYAPIGEGRGIFDNYSGMVSMAFSFLDAIIAVNTMTGLETIELEDSINFGPVTDPAGNMFHGCDIMINVMEFVN